jgi:acyl transferase domain-containing protein
VSSFGLSGTNAHVIIEQASVADELNSATRVPVVPLVVSAKTEQALRAQAQWLRARVQACPELGLVAAAYSLATTRTAMGCHAVVR